MDARGFIRRERPIDDVEEDRGEKSTLLGSISSSTYQPLHAFDVQDPNAPRSAPAPSGSKCSRLLASASPRARTLLCLAVFLLLGVILVFVLLSVFMPGGSKEPSHASGLQSARGPGVCGSDNGMGQHACGSGDGDKGSCEDMGCCWNDTAALSCTRPSWTPVYIIMSKDPTELGWELQLKLDNANDMPKLGAAFELLTVVATHETRDRIHVKITPTPDASQKPRWEVPKDLFPRPQHPEEMPSNATSLFFTPGVGEVFSFSIVRLGAIDIEKIFPCLMSDPSVVDDVENLLGMNLIDPLAPPPSGTFASTHSSSSGLTRLAEKIMGKCDLGPLQSLFNTSGMPFIFNEQYMELSSRVEASSHIMGLGESTLTSGLVVPRRGVITLWNADIPKGTDVNLYGSHPFYMEVRPADNTQADGTPAADGATSNDSNGFSQTTPASFHGSAHGVFLLNSNGMEVALQEDTITYRMLGGVMDFYFFLGPDPEQVTRQYHEVIGKPGMPPRWSLGFQQSRYGYPSLAHLKEVVSKYAAADLPLEVIWSDIDFMDNNKVFSFDPDRYQASEFKNFVDSLHMLNQRWVPILDCGVAAKAGFAPYEDGIEKDIFIKDRTGKPFLGQVWPGPTHWPDFLNPEATPYWQKWLQQMHSAVPFDGIWLDMNEPSNFCSGGDVCRVSSSFSISTMLTKCHLTCDAPDPDDPLNHPPYAINNGGAHHPLGHKTIPPTAMHYGGVSHYDAHNLYALGEAKATNEALSAIRGERPFILSRASFPGLGSHASHWTGDNDASWDQLRYSISSVVNSNLWGIPHVGADICGFIGETTEELCARWLSAGAFYPFVRDHSEKESPPQEAYLWPATTKAASTALGLRYKLLPYLYTSLFLAHTQGGTVARPPLFIAPEDPKLAPASSLQWMLGDSVMVVPVVTQGADSVEATFPEGRWYDAWTFAYTDGPVTRTIPAPLGHIPVFYRGGTIIPMQRHRVGAGVTTEDVAASRVTLLVALPADERLDSQMKVFSTLSYIKDKLEGHMMMIQPTGNASSKDNKPIPFWLLEDPVEVDPANKDPVLHVGVDAAGVLYADDGVTLSVGGDKSLEVWYGAYRTGTYSGLVKGEIHSTPSGPSNPTESAAQDARKLKYESVKIIGLPPPHVGLSYSAIVQGVEIYRDGEVSYDSVTGSLLINVTAYDFMVAETLSVQWQQLL